jgi:hypothetical protein
MTDKWNYLDPQVRARARVAADLLPPPGDEVVRELLGIIDRLDRPHVIHVREGGWEIQHALACRGDMLGCPVNVACSQVGWDRRTTPVGRYLITVDDDGYPVIGARLESESTTE